VQVAELQASQVFIQQSGAEVVQLGADIICKGWQTNRVPFISGANWIECGCTMAPQQKTQINTHGKPWQHNATEHKYKSIVKNMEHGS
jgi:hypothetical protein